MFVNLPLGVTLLLHITIGDVLVCLTLAAAVYFTRVS